MKNKLLKTISTLLFIAATVYANSAFAYSKSEDLGKAGVATDLYEIKCSTNTAGATYRLATWVRTGTASSAIKVSVATHKYPKATNSTDAVNGDSAYSPAAVNQGGNGTYYVTVGKTAASAAAVPYTLLYACQTSAGVATGTVLTQTQDQ